jgi:hypothetical protein
VTIHKLITNSLLSTITVGRQTTWRTPSSYLAPFSFTHNSKCFHSLQRTNHKLTGTPYLCMMYVRRGSNYVCLSDPTKMSEGWVNQSRINRTFRVLCVLFFNFFFSGSVCLFWNRLDDLWWGRIPSARVYKCLEHSQHPQPPLKLKFLVIGGSKA